MKSGQLAPAEALALLARKSDGAQFMELLRHGSLSVEVYKPVGVDRQGVHDRDEVYVVIAGTGVFACAGERHPFAAGALLFVPAGTEHRFEDFSDDFSTWVLFCGPQGGECPPLTTHRGEKA
jgi:mannose-6-phosphate isomerase-like protein (cupin superfamily)